MRYNNICEGIFIKRPNRFIAHVIIEGEEHICHVKNTGRCGELLVENARVLLEKSDSPNRKTLYDLVSVYKGDRLVNMDSQAPNILVKEWLTEKQPFGKIKYLKPEQKWGNSRFDFYMETENSKAYIEVKGVTLENNGVVSFPDAPSQRAVKHMKELCLLREQGFQCYVVFVVQMKGVKYFEPDGQRHPGFVSALSEARDCGINIVAMDCIVEQDNIKIDSKVKVVIP